MSSPRSTTKTLALACCLALTTACRKSSNTPPLAADTLGTAGGTIAVPDEATRLTVPAGALATDTYIRVDPGQISIVPGYSDVGPARTFSPSSVAFTAVAQVVLPFDPDLLAAAVEDREILIGFRGATGQVEGITPTAVDRTAETVTFETTVLGTFWVAAPDIVSANSLFPLNDGDVYRYDTGLVLTVEHTQVEPNFGSQTIVKVTFSRVGRTTGIYFVAGSNQLRKLGEFEVNPWQEILASSALLIGDRDPIGTVRPVSGTFLGYVPYGSSRVGYSGLARTTTEIAQRVRTSVPLGSFPTVHVPITTEFSQSGGLPGTDEIEFWFAESVGPVQIRTGNTIDRLLSATVDGSPVTAD